MAKFAYSKADVVFSAVLVTHKRNYRELPNMPQQTTAIYLIFTEVSYYKTIRH